MGFSPTVSGGGGSSINALPSYLYNGDVGLANIRNALGTLNTNRNSIIDVCILGDSITEGFGPNNLGYDDWMNRGYAGHLNRMFASLYHSVGPGFLMTGFPNGNNTYSAWRVGVTGFTLESGPNAIPNGSARNLPPFSVYYLSTTNGATLTYNFTGTGVEIFAINDQNNSDNLGISIDGGATQYLYLNTTGVGIVSKQITGLTYGNHTVTLTSGISGSHYCAVLGARPLLGDFGVRVNRIAVGGMDSNQLGTTGNAMMDFIKPKLTIISFLTNDASHSLTQATFQNAIQGQITESQKYGDVLLVSLALPTAAEAPYVATLKSLANSNNCAFLDIYSKWNVSATVSNGFNSGDSIHPNEQGHIDVARSIMAAITGDSFLQYPESQTVKFPAVPVNNLQVFVGDVIKNSAPSAGGPDHWNVVTSGISNNLAWVASTAYTKGMMVNTGGNVYACAADGTSGSTAPSGTGTGITDNTTSWNYVGPLAVFKAGANIAI